MSEQRVLVIENPARLRIDTGRIKIERDGLADVFIGPADVAVMCLEHHTATLSVAVLRALTDAGAVMLVTDARHLPSAMMQPLGITGTSSGRLRQQIALDSGERRTDLWRQIVAAKLATQAAALRSLGRKGVLRLERLSTQVQPGDKGNAEGQGARHYWRQLFSESFRRDKLGAEDAVNIRLNYGYAVLRAMVARALAAAGLNSGLGLGHSNSGNPFNLADDFMEPYRFVVDVHVARGAGSGSEGVILDSGAKKELLGFVKSPVHIAKQDMRLNAAIDATVASYVRVLGANASKLVLPECLVTTETWVSTDGA